jgi:hypothetical protein
MTGNEISRGIDVKMGRAAFGFATTYLIFIVLGLSMVRYFCEVESDFVAAVQNLRW